MEFVLLILDNDGYYKLEIAGGYCDEKCSICRKCINNRNIIARINEENIEFYQKYVLDHQMRTAELCRKIAETLYLDEDERKIIIQAALLHDIGKLLIPFKILSKDGTLSPFERRIIQLHPLKGAEWLRERGFLAEITTVVEVHHERVDGLGYPYGFKGDKVPFLARVLAVCDAFEVMVSGRHYKNPKTIVEAFEELKKGSGTHFDEIAVINFNQIIDEILQKKFYMDKKLYGEILEVCGEK